MQENMRVCKMGLESVWIDHAQGDVRLCAWTGYNLGNLQENTIEELWHGEKAEIFRKSMLDGNYQYCNCQACPYLANNEIQKMMVEYEVPEYPKYCSLSYEEQCNYVCVFCRKELYQKKENEDAKIDKIQKELSKFINQLDVISTNGVGEIFCSTRTLKQLSQIKTNNNIKIELESNGSLFNEKNWDKISNLGQYDLTVYITLHSFNEDTYQYLSGTNMSVNTVIENLHFIKKLREENIINHFEMATVICERNFREMPQYVERCLTEFNPDKIRLRYFFPYGVNDVSTEWFFDIRNPYHPYYNEFIKVMSNPIFDNPKVWKWQGESLSKFKEHPYVLEHKKNIQIGRLLAINDLHDSLYKWMKKHSFRKISLYGLSNSCKCFLQMINPDDSLIECIYDSNVTNKMFYCGYRINSINNFKDSSDVMIITSSYKDEITRKLQELKYQNPIIHIDDMLDEISC